MIVVYGCLDPGDTEGLGSRYSSQLGFGGGLGVGLSSGVAVPSVTSGSQGLRYGVRVVQVVSLASSTESGAEGSYFSPVVPGTVQRETHVVQDSEHSSRTSYRDTSDHFRPHTVLPPLTLVSTVVEDADGVVVGGGGRETTGLTGRVLKEQEPEQILGHRNSCESGRSLGFETGTLSSPSEVRRCVTFSFLLYSFKESQVLRHDFFTE